MNDLTHLRGMSEPFGFTFNVLDKGRKLLIHAVIFTSYEVADDDRIMKLPEPDCDPRMKAFLHFCMENHGKKTQDALFDLIKKRGEEIDELEKRLIHLKREIKNVHP